MAGYKKYTRDQLISELKRLYNEHGRATRTIVRDNSEISSATFADYFGTFNEAKEAAGLQTYERGSGEFWESSEYVTGDDYYQYIKDIVKCERCGEDCFACIEFHHAFGEKDRGIGKAGWNNSAEVIYSEIKKTVPLCANCHKKHHSNSHGFDASTLESIKWPKPEEIYD